MKIDHGGGPKTVLPQTCPGELVLNVVYTALANQKLDCVYA